jgi:hypothetical protein
MIRHNFQDFIYEIASMSMSDTSPKSKILQILQLAIYQLICNMHDWKYDYNMTDFQAKICEKFNIKSLTDNQSKSITAIIDGKEVFVGTKTRSVKRVLTPK